MVDATQAMESSFVDVDLIRSSPSKRAVIVSEGEYKQAEYNGEKYMKLEIDVEVDAKRKKYAPNKDSVRNISGAYGVNTKNWIGQIVMLSITKVRGRDCLIALPMSTKTE